MKAGVFDADSGVLTECVARLILESYEGEPSLLVSALAHAHARHVVRAVRDPSSMANAFAWLERMDVALALEAASVAMLREAGASAARLLCFDPGAFETIRILDRGVSEILDRRSHVASAYPAFEEELDGVIAAFLLRLEESDPLSAEHSRAVSLWCRRLAARLDLGDEAIRFAGRCGMLHDVGKARTPPRILHAPRALTDDEWVVMRDHTVGGARMLVAVERLRPFEVAARSHHERLDGKGYPDRLEACDIPPMVRIVTVADCFNAMIGRRPYRLPLSPANALDQLTRHTGTQFDPAVVEAMIDIVERPLSAA